MAQPSRELTYRYQNKVYRPQFSLNKDETQMSIDKGISNAGEANKIAKKLYLEFIEEANND